MEKEEREAELNTEIKNLNDRIQILSETVNEKVAIEKELTKQLQIAEQELQYLKSVLEELNRAQTEAELEEIRRELQEGGYIRADSGKKQMKQHCRHEKKQKHRRSRCAVSIAIAAFFLLLCRCHTKNPAVVMLFFFRFDHIDLLIRMDFCTCFQDRIDIQFLCHRKDRGKQLQGNIAVGMDQKLFSCFAAGTGIVDPVFQLFLELNDFLRIGVVLQYTVAEINIALPVHGQDQILVRIIKIACRLCKIHFMTRRLHKITPDHKKDQQNKKDTQIG